MGGGGFIDLCRMAYQWFPWGSVSLILARRLIIDHSRVTHRWSSGREIDDSRWGVSLILARWQSLIQAEWLIIDSGGGGGHIVDPHMMILPWWLIIYSGVGDLVWFWWDNLSLNLVERVSCILAGRHIDFGSGRIIDSREENIVASDGMACRWSQQDGLSLILVGLRGLLLIPVRAYNWFCLDSLSVIQAGWLIIDSGGVRRPIIDSGEGV